MTDPDANETASVTTAVAESVKFSSKMDPEVLDALRAYAEASGRTLSAVLTEAGRAYLARVGVRPAFREATRAVLDEHAELLERLAR